MRVSPTPFLRSWTPAMLASIAFVTAGLCAGTARATSVQPIDIRIPVTTGPAERTFFVGTGSTLEQAVGLRDALRELGARNVNLFLPDMVIVCDFPVGASFAAVPPSFRHERGRTVLASPSRAYAESWGWIANAYANADRASIDAADRAVAGTDANAGFDDVVRVVSPERAESVRRDLEKSARTPGLAPRPQPARDFNQNSEFMGGTMLFNFIYPESNGTLDSDSENWSDADLTAAKQGAVQGLLSWQTRWPNMDINYAIRTYDRVPTAYEPIQHDMASDPLWIVDAMRSLGWGLHSSDELSVVHEFNEAKRDEVGTQWVSTAFIASSRNVGTHRFGGGGANYTAYAYLGGPLIVEPFPAGTDPNAIGETLVFSQIVQHELGHNFWTLDEYPGSPSPCPETSGYLNYPNSNMTTVDPEGNTIRCVPMQNCIMNNATRLNLGRPWCTYSEGHMGVIDANNNGAPDMFEAKPVIEFATEGPETVTTNDLTLHFRAISQAVPSQNLRINVERRISYAVKLRRGWFSLGGTSQYPLPADDGNWDEVQEDCTLRISLAQVGLSLIVVSAENAVGFASDAYVKRIYFTGVNYSRTAVTVKPGRIDVTWETAGDVFGATFNVYRLARGEGLPGTVLDSNVGPSGPPKGGFTPYRYVDRDVQPGKDYRYYVEGVFTLPFEGGTKEYRSPSKIIAQTAMIPNGPGGILSNVAPNPSKGNITVSLQVPRTYGGSPSAPTRLATPLEVAIYDVRGQLVRTLRTGSEVNDVVTLHWDGTNAAHLPAPSGVYFVRAVAGDSESVRKIVLIR